MLADFSHTSTPTGTLNSEVHLSSTFRHELLDFIAGELPRWRDDPDRPRNTSETTLTEHLCDYLTTITRKSLGWDILQFRTEATDEERKNRKLDLVAKPCGAIIWIDGFRYTHYDPLLPVECKRLPTPPRNDRDEREYVFSKYSSTGGIQRFKAGDHGGSHTIGGMIAYVQDETAAVWDERVRGWINELTASGEPSWSAQDLLELESDDLVQGIAILKSSHPRDRGLQDIQLSHLWVTMN
jgi:hypothetical protein